MASETTTQSLLVTKLAQSHGIEDPRFLMNRTRFGTPVREEIVQYLIDMKEGTLVVDFADVEEMSVSVAEELGPRLFGEFLGLRHSNDKIFLAYAHINAETADGWEKMFRVPQQKVVACLLDTFDGCSFRGHRFVGQGLPDALRDVLDLIYTFGAMNSSMLVAKGVSAPSRKLHALTSDFGWLLRREQQSLDERAWAYLYSPIVRVRSE